MDAVGTLPSSASQARGGDRLERLVDENIGWLQGWLRGRVSDPELVHDISQEAFLRALRQLPRLRDVERFPGWLFRIARNLLLDHVRRSRRRRTRLATTEELDGVPHAAASGPESDGGALREEADKVLQAVRALPPRYRDPFLLRHTQDLSYEDIAKILGITRNAVQVRMFRARQMLQKRIER